MNFRRIAAMTAALVLPVVALAGPFGAPAPEPAPTGIMAIVQPLLSATAPIVAGFGGALLIFIGGWFVARLVSWLAYGALIRTDVDDRIAASLGLTFMLEAPGDKNRLERILAAILYYVLMLFVLVAALQQAGLAEAAMPIQRFLGSVAEALPNIGKAGAILGVSYLVAYVLRRAVGAFLERTDMHARFAQLSGPEQGGDAGAAVSNSAQQAVFWLVMTVGLAGAFDALQITPIAEPLKQAMDRIVGQLPTVGFAAILIAAAWIFGRIARNVIENAMASVGADAAVERAGLARLFAGRRPGEIVGIAAQVFILLQATIAALQQVGLRTLADPLTDMMGRFWMLLPDLAVAALILGFGWYGGGIARTIVTNVLKGIGFDDLSAKLGFGKLHDWNETLDEPSELIGAGVQGGVFLVALAQVFENLKLHTWAEYVNGLLEYAVRNVAVAMIIVGVGFALGNFVRDLIAARKDADAEAQQWLGSLARYAVLVFAFTMAVRHLDVAEDFVLMSFGLLFGSLCLAIALAFGLGSREVAGDIVRRQYDRAQKRIAVRGEENASK